MQTEQQLLLILTGHGLFNKVHLVSRLFFSHPVDTETTQLLQSFSHYLCILIYLVSYKYD